MHLLVQSLCRLCLFSDSFATMLSSVHSDIHNNVLTSVTSAMLSSLTAINYIYLQNNLITSVPANFVASLGLSFVFVSLSLSQCGCIFITLFSSLSNNNITSVDASAFTGASNLQTMCVGEKA